MTITLDARRLPSSSITFTLNAHLWPCPSLAEQLFLHAPPAFGSQPRHLPVRQPMVQKMPKGQIDVAARAAKLEVRRAAHPFSSRRWIDRWSVVTQPALDRQVTCRYTAPAVLCASRAP